VVSLKKLQAIVVLRNNLLSNDFLQSLISTNLSLRRIELGGLPFEFQTRIRLEGGVEPLCECFRTTLEVVRFEYCAALGDETIRVIAKQLGPQLKELAIVRNFTEKIAKIGDSSLLDLASHCPNIEALSLVHSRRFSEKVGTYVGMMNKLKILDLSHCTVSNSLVPLKNCLQLEEIKLAGDSWVRDLVLRSIS
jgi:hypothetical protein